MSTFLRRKTKNSEQWCECVCPRLAFAVIFESCFLNVVLLVPVGSPVACVGRFLSWAGILSVKPAQDNGEAARIKCVRLTSSGGMRLSRLRGLSSSADLGLWLSCAVYRAWRELRMAVTPFWGELFLFSYPGLSCITCHF